MFDFIVGTSNGVMQFRDSGITLHCLSEYRISAVHVDGADDSFLLAGSYGQGLFRSEDGGEHWSQVSDGLTAPAIRTFAPDPFENGAILAGTEPGRIFRSHDAGVSWEGLEEIARLPRADQWYLPYSPRAGAVRNIFAPPATDHLLASVEVGGLLDSADRGATWTISPILGDTDIHHITGQPDDPEVLYAALGWASLKSVPVPPDSPPLGGIARSPDGGQTWTKFHSDYTRAVIVPPTRPDLLLAGPASKVGEGGRIEVSKDRGDSWLPAGDGIETPMADMVERFIAAPDGSILAICSGGGLFRSEPGEWHWKPVLPEGLSVKVESIAFTQQPPDAAQ